MKDLNKIKSGINAYIKLNGYTKASFAKKHSVDKAIFDCVRDKNIADMSQNVEEDLLREIMHNEGITLEDLDVSRSRVLELESELMIDKLKNTRLMNSRDPKRIKPFLVELEHLWSTCPDLRFGQLVVMLSGKVEGDPFYVEDDKWLDAINKEMKS